MQRIKNSRINTVKRRGKYIILELDNGIAAVIHLRMTGKLLYTRQNQPIDKYACVIFTLEDKNKLVYADVRRLGTLDAVTNQELPRLKGLYSLGAEPLTADFSVDYLQKVLQKSKSRIKSFLLNQKNVAGLGNIYVDEALFLSRINPLKAAGSLSMAEIKALHEAVNQVIGAGIKDGGTTFRDYRNGLGGKGTHQDHLYVYSRKGESCRVCGALIEKRWSAAEAHITALAASGQTVRRKIDDENNRFNGRNCLRQKYGQCLFTAARCRDY